MNNLETLCYIHEQTSFEEDYKGNFGYEIEDKGNRFFVKFPAVLQSFGVKNRNGREYDMANILHCIQTDEMIQQLLSKNSWIGEIDHPAVELNGQELTTNRISTPSLERSSHYIRSPRAEGNLLVANIQTDSSNQYGMNMAIKIVDGKIVPCFSARVFGRLENRNGKPIVMVKKLITYDWVLFQSHREASARINQPLQESANDFSKYMNQRIIFLPQLAQMVANSSKETEFICESFGLSIEDITGFTSNADIVIQENKNVYVQPISDRSIRKKTKSMLKDWMNQ